MSEVVAREVDTPQGVVAGLRGKGERRRGSTGLSSNLALLSAAREKRQKRLGSAG